MRSTTSRESGGTTEFAPTGHTVKALFFVRPGQLRFEEVADPQLLDPTDVIVRPIAATTCDLDHQLIAGKTPFDGPFALGHECVAEVVEAGPGDAGLESSADDTGRPACDPRAFR